MTYFLAEDTKISGKWIQLILRRMDIMDLSDSQPVSLLSVADRLTSASQSVSLSVKDRQTDLNNNIYV